MALTQLDPTPALILIDLQKMVVGLAAAHLVNEIVERYAELARVFRERGFLVVLVNVAGRAPGRTQTQLGIFQQRYVKRHGIVATGTVPFTREA